MDGVARLLLSLEMSSEDIAKASRLAVARVRSLMEGAPATLAELRAMSHGLRIPMRSFAIGEQRTDQETSLGLLFRGAIAESGPGQRTTIEYVAGFVEGALEVLPEHSDASEWISELRPSEQTFAEAQRLAHLFRSLFMAHRVDEPAHDLPQMLVDRGVVLSKLRFSKYEGASVIAGGYPFIFVSPRFQARMLFTVAHELGHVIAHHNGGDTAVFDVASRIGAWRHRTLNERFVDTFASILLLPDRGVARALRTIRSVLKVTSANIGDIEILYLARLYGVSFEVAARRCEQLELLPGGGAASLTTALKKEFRSPERRADALGLPPRPAINLPHISDNLIYPLIRKIEEQEISAGWAAERFGLSIEEVYSLHARIAREDRN